VANSWRYTNGDVNTLPFSYTLGNLPKLLGEGIETPLSKIYTVPSTAAAPFPTLPITFPSLALYLQSALQNSRKAMNDSSSGLRKLARMVESCYPAELAPDDDEPRGSERFTGLFKRVIGIGGKSSKTGRGQNEDVFELVTPFVPDAWNG
jgi:hypothetical protein